MNFENMLARIPARYWGLLALAAWAVVAVVLASGGPYGLEEGAAKALLFCWSIADQVASSVVTFSAPDLRAVVFLPVGILWTGSVFAAKVFAILALAATGALMYLWARARFGAEAALLATGLLLIAPASLLQLDALGAGIFLLLAFVLGGVADRAYRESPRPFGGWYFAQLALCALSVSLHPAGLAYPLALLWAWHGANADRAQRRYFVVGIGFVTLFMLLVRMGWNDVAWMPNPLRSLAALVLEAPAHSAMEAGTWLVGIVVAIALLLVLVTQYRELLSDLVGRCLLGGVVFGVGAADASWSYLCLAVVLFFGFPRLLRPAAASAKPGFFRQRGIAFVLLFFASLLFMQGDKERYLADSDGKLSPQDQLIMTLADEIAATRKAADADREEAKKLHLRVASEWPSRTMVACRCDTLPLPPAAADPQAQLAMLRTITHVLLDPKEARNLGLSSNFAALGGAMETGSLQPGGVMLRMKAQGSPAAAR